MNTSQIATQHQRLCDHASLPLQQLLGHLSRHLSQDGWTIVQRAQLDLFDGMASDPTVTSYFMLIDAKGLGDTTLCISTSVKSGYDPHSQFFFHDFGLQVANVDGDVLFETPLQTWQGSWTAQELNELFKECMSPAMAGAHYNDIARRLSH